jgi:histone deacetylase complex regulatory component SIN3
VYVYICLSEKTGCCRISVAVAASRVRELFRDCPGLVAGFNAFLPEVYKMEMEKATRYVETVRDALGRDYPAKHDEFLDVLTDFRNNTIGTGGGFENESAVPGQPWPPRWLQRLLAQWLQDRSHWGG